VWGRAWRRVVRGRRRSAFPDEYATWGDAAARAALAAAADFDVRVVISTAPPYSSHVAASRVARELGVPLVLDYRDAWVDNPFRQWEDDVRKERERRLEEEVLAAAAAVVVVTEGMAASYRGRLDAGRETVVITNGFDEQDFADPSPVAGEGPFEVVYAGQFYEGRMPWSFLEALRLYGERGNGRREGIKATFVGPVARGMAAEVLRFGVAVELTGPLSHRDTIAAIRRADVNLLIIGDRPGAAATLTGKVFEYLRAGKPILALVPPEGEAARLVRRVNGGLVVPPSDPAAIADALGVLVAGGKKPTSPPPADVLAEYERSRLTGKLAALLDRVTAYAPSHPNSSP